MKDHKQLGALAAAVTLIFSAFAFAMGDAYELTWFTIDGGGGTSSGGDYVLTGTIGQHDAGTMTSPSGHALVGGFWAGADTTPTPPSCPADLTGDGVVDVFDLLDLLSAWGPCPGSPCAPDITGDGAVDVFDLLDLLSAWGPC